MYIRRLLAVVALTIGLMLGGCTAAAPTEPTPPGSLPTPESRTAAPSPAATDTGDDGDDGDDANGGDVPHQVPDLEAMLPSEVLGVAVNKASIRGAVEELDLSDDILDAIAAGGGSAAETEVAVGTTEDQSLLIMAIRVPGLDPANLLAALVADNDPTAFPVREGRIAGKDVTSLGDSQFFYATGDILFSVFADVNAANEIISQLP